jgi:hypothetical protein
VSPYNLRDYYYINYRVPDESADAIFATFLERNRFLIESGSVQRYADPKEFVPR